MTPSTKCFSNHELSLIQGLEKGFIDYYVKYARRLTDAPEIFHIGCGFGILSGVVGNLAYDPLLRSHPNLWILLLGPTTVYRKTTSLRIARGLLTDFDPNLMIASDFSPQALIQEFADRRNLPGVLFRDETSGLFRSMARSDYMAGAKELMIKLYDGDDFARSLRKERIQVDAPYFVWLGGAVTSKLMESLTEEDVFSGLMVRFILLNPDGPPDYRPLRYETAAEDWMRESLLDHLHNIHKRLARPSTIIVGPSLTHRNEGKTFVLTSSGLDRWNAYVRRIEENVTGDPIAEKISSRAGPLALKLMMLLGADRLTRTSVQMSTVIVPYEILLEALYYAEMFRTQSIRTLSGVGLTKIERTMDRVRALVRRVPGISRKDLMNHLSLTAPQMSEIKRTLIERGLVKIGVNGREEIYFPGGNP